MAAVVHIRQQQQLRLFDAFDPAVGKLGCPSTRADAVHDEALLPQPDRGLDHHVVILAGHQPGGGQLFVGRLCPDQADVARLGDELHAGVGQSPGHHDPVEFDDHRVPELGAGPDLVIELRVGVAIGEPPGP